MVGLNRLPSHIDLRKMMFLHKSISLPAGPVSRNKFIRKPVLFINDKTHVTSGFIPDICLTMLKYNLHSIINNFLAPECYVPSTYVWKSVVKRSITSRETQLWDYRTSVDTDFVFFRILYPCIKSCFHGKKIIKLIICLVDLMCPIFYLKLSPFTSNIFVVYLPTLILYGSILLFIG